MAAHYILCALFLLFQTENSLANTTPRIVSPSSQKKITETNNKTISLENISPLFWEGHAHFRYAFELIEDDVCKNMTKLILARYQNLTSWAMKFYDASGKLPEGVLAGSVYHLGNFDECLNIGKEFENSQGVTSKYCLTDIEIDIPEYYLTKNGSVWENFRTPIERHHESLRKMFWAICVPSVCSTKDVGQVINKILSIAFSETNLQLTAKIPKHSCITSAHDSTRMADIIYISIISAVMAAVIIGTIFHLIYFRNQVDIHRGTLQQSLIAFSVIFNLKKLLSPTHKNDMFLECISGIKFISMVLIIAGHTMLFLISGPILNKNYWEEILFIGLILKMHIKIIILHQAITKVENSVFLNNPLLVDTFLLLSGFLFCRILLHELDRRTSVNVFLLYIFRYIRLTPAYLVMLGLYFTWLPRLDVGPLWSRVIAEKERCLTTWWTNILYINNYVFPDKMCMFQSWYLSVDTQLFVLAPAVIYPLWKWRKIGECILAMCTIASIGVPFFITLINKLDPTLMFYPAEFKDILQNEYFTNSYIKTHMRSESYCFGLLCGYILYRIQKLNYQLSKKTVLLGWLFGSLSLIAPMFSITIFYGPRRHFSAIEAALYTSLHRAFWSIGTSWFLIACITNNSGPIRNFLKWRPFVPLSRLTYCAYLVNGLVELHSTATVRSPRYLSHFNLFSLTLSHIVLTFTGAILLSILFESPILSLERILLNCKKENKTNKRDDEGS